jgi:NADH-quinone oxidoreductase subunit N
MWVPDVYQGAPMSVTLFVSTAPKVAAFGMTIRLLIDMLPTLHTQWQPLLILVAILSMGIGNLLAIAQENVKRMLAYSGIAHIGYLSLGLIAVTQAGYQDALFYMVVYAFMSLAAFSMLIVLSRQGFDCEKISDLKGLNQRSPWLAFMMLLVMFSMAGIPPLIGFFAKLSVLEALIGAHLVWLAVVAIVCAIIGLYYYLRVVKVMYFDEAETNEDIRWQGDERVIVSVNCLALLFFGLFPGAIFMLCHLAF